MTEELFREDASLAACEATVLAVTVIVLANLVVLMRLSVLAAVLAPSVLPQLLPRLLIALRRRPRGTRCSSPPSRRAPI